MIIKTTILVILITINFINTQELLDDDLLEVKLSEDVDDEKSPNSSPLLLVGDAALRSDPKHIMMIDDNHNYYDNHNNDNHNYYDNNQ